MSFFAVHHLSRCPRTTRVAHGGFSGDIFHQRWTYVPCCDHVDLPFGYTTLLSTILKVTRLIRMSIIYRSPVILTQRTRKCGLAGVVESSNVTSERMESQLSLDRL